MLSLVNDRHVTHANPNRWMEHHGPEHKCVSPGLAGRPSTVLIGEAIKPNSDLVTCVDIFLPAILFWTYSTEFQQNREGELGSHS